MVFPEEEVHIVELYGIGTVLCDKVAENCGGPFRRFHALLVAIGCVDAAETAVEGASDAGVMDCSAFAEEGWPKIFCDRYTMEGVPGELVRALHRTFGVVARKAEDVLI